MPTAIGSGSSFWKCFTTPGHVLSLISTEDSVAANKINIWAIIETVIAVCLFWWIALHWNTFLLLYSSLFVAPLLLLRSDASIAMGASWFEDGFLAGRWSADKTERHVQKTEFTKKCFRYGVRFSIVGFAIVLFVVAFNLAGSKEYQGFPLISQIIIAIYKFIFAMVVSQVFVVFGFLFGLLATGADIRYINGTAFAMKWGAWQFGLALVLLVATLYFAYSKEKQILASAPGFFLSIGLSTIEAFAIIVVVEVFVILIVAFFARFAAVIANFQSGYRNLPANITKLVFCSAPGHVPELIPGLGPTSRFRLQTLLQETTKRFREARAVDKFDILATQLPVTLLWFAPAFCYRFLLKSTMWLWWTLYIIGGSPDISGGVHALEIDVHRKRWANLSFWLAFASLAIFFVSNVARPYFEDQLSNAPHLPVVDFLYFIDWGHMPLFGYLGLASAALTIIVWFWADNIVKDKDITERAAGITTRMLMLGHVSKWKAGLGILTIALTMLYVALFVNSLYRFVSVSVFAADCLHFVYGRYADAVIWTVSAS